MSSSSHGRKVFSLIAIVGASILATVWVTSLESLLAFIPPDWLETTPTPAMTGESQSSSLAVHALEKVLKDATPIFGRYTDFQSPSSTWMSSYPDDTKIVHMNIPGAHDAATWNYSEATQQSLKHITDLIDKTAYSFEWFRCQDFSIVDMLHAGIRVFDLRYAQDIANSSLVFWHGPALQSQTATVEAVLFGFYRWLDDYPSETVLLSFQYEANKSMGNVDTAEVQLQLYNLLTSPAAQQYILQSRNELGTLGAARGKIILLHRFDLDLLSPEYEASIPGVHFSPQKWTVNSASIKLTYNAESNGAVEEGIAYIEDYYQPRALPSSSLTLEENIDIKFNATRSNLLLAASDSHPDGLFWTFASGTNIYKDDGELSVTPRMMALGELKEDHAVRRSEGVNPRLLELIRDMKGDRLGVVMFDFFEEPVELLETFLGLRHV